VLNIVGRILELQEFAFARNFSVTYQARILIELKTVLPLLKVEFLLIRLT
jgi:hypothetical protein